MAMLLGIFAKDPLTFPVKTRLAKTIGRDKATSINDLFLRYTVSECQQCSAYQTVLYWLGNSPPPYRLPMWPQPASAPDLGAKLTSFFEKALWETPSAQAIAIGIDCLDLKNQDILQAFRILESHDAVIGPSEDGGYYLIGLNRSAWRRDEIHALFENIPWSSPKTFKAQVERLEKLEKRYSIGERKPDIDDYRALQRFLQTNHPLVPKIKRILT